MATEHTHPAVIKAGTRVLAAVEIFGLVVIAIATVVAGTLEIREMIAARTVTLGDLLLLFIYLEVLAMVGVYLESGSLPIRMPLYIAMVALARHLILDIKNLSEWEIVSMAAAILIIAMAVLAIRFGHIRWPYPPRQRDGKQVPAAD